MLSLSDMRDFARAESFFIDPPDEWDELDSMDEDVDGEVEEIWIERKAEHVRD